VMRVRTREVQEQASAAVGQPPEALRETLQALRREAGPPWGADQKAAALLAWLVLRSGPRTGP